METQKKIRTISTSVLNPRFGIRGGILQVCDLCRIHVCVWWMVKESSVGYREELCCYVFILIVFFHVKDLPPFGVEEYSLAIKLAKKICSGINTVQLLLLKWKERKI